MWKKSEGEPQNNFSESAHFDWAALIVIGFNKKSC